MGLDDFGDDWVRPIEQDEFFDDEIGNILHSVSAMEKEKVTCYYKLINRLPDIEYEAKCAACDGFPIKEGCTYYTTQDHIEQFAQRMNGTQ